MVKAFNVALPASAASAVLEDEATEGEVNFGEAFSSQGGVVYLKNTGTVNALIGGRGTDNLLPLNTGDPMMGPIPLGPNDRLTAQVATGGTAGQITVLGIVK